MRSRPDIAEILVSWRHRPVAAVVVAVMVVAVTTAVVAVGGPPTPVTHLYYVGVVLAAVLWGPWCGLTLGLGCGILAEPGARALLGELGELHPGWMLRAVALMLVGWVCGSLTQALRRRVEDLETLNRETIFAFVRAIDARDPYTARHSEKVATYAVQLAAALRLPRASCDRIKLAGLLHDVGKVALERSVLHKPGKLDDDEWELVRRHPGLSAHILGGVARFASFLPGVRHHHERYDGRGYPDGLAGDAIPLDARILAVADAYDAMTSDRSYRPALSHQEAVRRLREGAGSQFDPVCVATFAELDLTAGTDETDLVPLLDLAAMAVEASPAAVVATSPAA